MKCIGQMMNFILEVRQGTENSCFDLVCFNKIVKTNFCFIVIVLLQFQKEIFEYGIKEAVCALRTQFSCCFGNFRIYFLVAIELNISL